MRTTFDLPDEVLRAAKKRAADEGVPLREPRRRYRVRRPVSASI